MATTVLPAGITNAAVDSALSSYTAMDPAKNHQWFSDFDTFTAADWTVTETQAGATQGLATGDGGWLALVNSAANNDLNAIQLATATFAVDATKACWIKARFKLSNATNAAAVIGLQVIDTTPLAVSDGLFFSKPAAATTLNAAAFKSSTGTTKAIGTMADDTFATCGVHYSPNSSLIYLYFNDVNIGQMVATNFPTGAALTVSIAVANGTAAANTMSVDYLMVATER
jgi:hypothetical protein